MLVSIFSSATSEKLAYNIIYNYAVVIDYFIFL